MSAIATDLETIWRLPPAVDAARRHPPLSQLSLRRAKAVVLQFLDTLVPPPGALSSSDMDDSDWPRFPGVW
jgi:hypothetical protein